MIRAPRVFAALAALMASVPTPSNPDPKLRVQRGSGPRSRRRGIQNPLGQQNLYGLRAADVKYNMAVIRSHRDANGPTKHEPVNLLKRLQTSLGSQAVHRIRRNGGAA